MPIISQLKTQSEKITLAAMWRMVQCRVRGRSQCSVNPAFWFEYLGGEIPKSSRIVDGQADN